MNCILPAPSAACLAGACPDAAMQTFPMYTSCISPTSTPALLIASLIATLPSWLADRDEREPWNEPIGVLTALTITAFFGQIL